MPGIIPRERIAEWLSVSSGTLIRYEARGLVTPVREGAVEGYAPEELPRLRSIVAYQWDLGINLAGVEAVLKLRDHIADVHRRLAVVSRQFTEALEERFADDPHGG